MLCVNCEKRATMEEILNHPWVIHTDNWDHKYLQKTKKEKEINETLLAQMQILGFDKETVIQSIKEKKYNRAYGTYQLLKRKSKKPSSQENLLHHNTSRHAHRTGTFTDGCTYSLPTSNATSPNTSQVFDPKEKLHDGISDSQIRLSLSPNTISLNQINSKLSSRTQQSKRIPTLRVQSSKFPAREELKLLIEQQGNDDNIEFLNSPSSKQRKSSLRYQLSPRDVEEVKSLSPTLIKKHGTSPSSPTKEEEIKKDVAKIKELKSSCEVPVLKLNNLKITTELANDQNPTIVTLRNNRFIRKNVHSMKRRTLDLNKNGNDGALSSTLFSLSKKQIISGRGDSNQGVDVPRALRTPFSASSTKDPKLILTLIEKYFTCNNIPFEPLGPFSLKGLYCPSKVRFEIEVCSIPNLPDVYSVRMQRVDGDWESYKDFCEELLSNIEL